MNNMQRLVGVSLCFFILCLWICPVDCFAQGGFRVGAYVKFIDYEGKTRYGTIEAITGDPFKILTFEGDSVEMRVGNLRRIENMGMTKKVTPNWSYVEQDLEVYEFIDTSGKSTQKGSSLLRMPPAMPFWKSSIVCRAEISRRTSLRKKPRPHRRLNPIQKSWCRRIWQNTITMPSKERT
jgi:hypothetical protein